MVSSRESQGPEHKVSNYNEPGILLATVEEFQELDTVRRCDQKRSSWVY